MIGGGASGVEAVELAISKGARNTVIVARSDKVDCSLRVDVESGT